MNAIQLTALADRVLTRHEQKNLPINLLAIAGREGIDLYPDSYGLDFLGQIRYSGPEFVLLYEKPRQGLPQTRVNFTIAHELGHYFIPEHNRYIRQASRAGSTQPFANSPRREGEADVFAAALLVPTFELDKRIGRNKGSKLPLNEILKLAKNCDVSAEACVFRFTQYWPKPMVAIVSCRGEILYWFTSNGASPLRYALSKGQSVPDKSKAAHLFRETSDRIRYDDMDGKVWFPGKNNASAPSQVWEETVKLGDQGRVLTVLSWS